MLIGVVSDTHGFYDPRVPPLLGGVEHILHAGDIGAGRIIEQLSEIAPVTAVRGNNDRECPESQFPEAAALEFFNPGAAGKRRFKVVPSIGLLELSSGRITGRILVL